MDRYTLLVIVVFGFLLLSQHSLLGNTTTMILKVSKMALDKFNNYVLLTTYPNFRAFAVANPNDDRIINLVSLCATDGDAVETIYKEDGPGAFKITNPKIADIVCGCEVSEATSYKNSDLRSGCTTK